MWGDYVRYMCAICICAQVKDDWCAMWSLRCALVSAFVIALRIGECVPRLFQLDASHLAQGPIAFAEELLEGHGRLGLEPEGTRALVLATPVARLLCYDEVLARVEMGSKPGAGRDGSGGASKGRPVDFSNGGGATRTGEVSERSSCQTRRTACAGFCLSSSSDITSTLAPPKMCRALVTQMS